MWKDAMGIYLEEITWAEIDFYHHFCYLRSGLCSGLSEVWHGKVAVLWVPLWVSCCTGRWRMTLRAASKGKRTINKDVFLPEGRQCGHPNTMDHLYVRTAPPKETRNHFKMRIRGQMERISYIFHKRVDIKSSCDKCPVRLCFLKEFL